MRLLPLVALVLVVGCVAPGEKQPPGGGAATGASLEWSTLALGFGQGHDHNDPKQHNFSTPNFRVLGYDPLFSPEYGGSTPAGYLCGDAKETQGGRRLAVVESRSDVGFTIADVTDSAHPKWLGELVMRRTHVYDVAMLPDGKEVVAVTSGLDTPQNGPLAGLRAEGWGLRAEGSGVRAAGCGGTPTTMSEDLVPRAPSVLLIDISDPSKPSIIDQRPLEGLGHSVFATTLDGKQLIMTATTGTTGTDSFDLYDIMPTALGPRLERLSTYFPDLAPGVPNTDLGGHSEAWIMKHPVTGKPIAYVQSRQWIRTVDLSDLANPREIGKWTDYDPARAGSTGSMHSIFPLDHLVDGTQRDCVASASSPAGCGRHYVVVGPEWGGHPTGVPSGVVWVLDDTDPAKMHEVAAWTLPHEVEWAGEYMFSTHYFAVVSHTLFVSMYHGGVWAVDLTGVGKENFTLLPSVGVFLPTNVSPKPPSVPVRWAPTVEEVRPMPDGTLVTFDSNSGLYTFAFDESKPMPAPAPWPLLPVSHGR